MIWLVRLVGFIFGYVAAIATFAALNKRSIIVGLSTDPTRTKGAFKLAFCEIFFYPCVELPLFGGSKFRFYIRNASGTCDSRKITDQKRNKKVIHNNRVSGKKNKVKGD